MLALLVAAEVEQHLRGQRVVYAHEHGGRRIGRRDFLERQQIRRRVETEPVELLRDEHAQESERAHLPRHGDGKAGLAIPPRRMRRDRVGGERARERTDLALHFGEWRQ